MRDQRAEITLRARKRPRNRRAIAIERWAPFSVTGLAWMFLLACAALMLAFVRW